MKALLVTLIVAAVVRISAAAQEAFVTVDAGHIIAPINPLLYGINAARWDESLFPGTPDEMLLTCSRDAIAKIKASRVTVLKYPGGNDADSYVWNSPANNSTEMDTEEYLALCREVNAVPFITVNFNQPPELAAAWVRYCNSGDRLHVPYWEIGDEQWGWWAKGHSTPEAYADKFITFVRAMKAVDPTIKVATNVFLGIHPEQWTERVLAAAGEYVDMLTVTFFPQQWGNENDDSLLASSEHYLKQFLRLRADVERAVGRAKADRIVYVNVGYNSVNHSPGPQTLQVVNALWVADMLGVMAGSKTDIACYWALHNAFPPRKGDYGYLSSEGHNQPSYTYYVFPLLRTMFGDTLVMSSSNDPRLRVYASRTAKRLSVLLINTKATHSREALVKVAGFTASGTVRAVLLDSTHRNVPLPDIQIGQAGLKTIVPPYAILAMEVIAQDSVVPPHNLALAATATASTYSTIGPAFGPASAVDGNTSTRWNSAAWTKSDGKEHQWLRLSWDNAQTFTTVTIRWGESPAKRYRIEISSDGESWRTISEQENGMGGTETVEVPGIPARHVRVLGLEGTGGRSTISAYSIREVEVYSGEIGR